MASLLNRVWSIENDFEIWRVRRLEMTGKFDSGMCKKNPRVCSTLRGDEFIAHTTSTHAWLMMLNYVSLMVGLQKYLRSELLELSKTYLDYRA